MKKGIVKLITAASIAGFMPLAANAQTVLYSVPDNVYYESSDDGRASSEVTHGSLRMIMPPHHKMRFVNKSKGHTTAPVWTVDGVEVNAETNGDFIYRIGAERSSDYLYPKLTYGSQVYHAAMPYADNNSGTDISGTCGIRATNSRVGLSLLNPMWNNWKRMINIQYNVGYGGQNMAETFPKAYTNMISAKSHIDFVCDGNMDTYFERFGDVVANDYVLVDCGEIVERGEIKIHFADGNRLEGKASVMVAEKDGEYKVVGDYDSQTLEGNVFVCNANNIQARYIAFMITEVYENAGKPFFVEIEEPNIRQFSKVGRKEIKYPNAFSTRGTYGDNALTNVLDNDSTTFYWSNSTCEVGDVITIDCGEVAARNNIIFGITKNDQPEAGVIEISADNNTWTQIGSFKKTDFTSSLRKTFDAQGAEARYVRMRITESLGYWLQIADLVVEGATPKVEYEDVAPIMQSIYTCYPKPRDPFLLDKLTFFATSFTASNNLIPVGAELDVYIRKIDSKFNMTDTLAHAILNTASIKRNPSTYASGTRIFVLETEFYTDPEDGIGEPVKSSVLLDCDFAIEVSGLDTAPGLDLAFMYGDEVISRGNYGLPRFFYRADPSKVQTYYAYGKHNLWWNLFGQYITMRPEEEAVTFYQDETEKTMEFYSSVDLSSVSFDAPSWITVELGNSLSEGATTLKLTVNEANKEREGEVVFSCNEGVVSTLKVTQTAASGINSVKTDVADPNAPIFDLLGRKVVNPTSGIYIQNGKKVVLTK